MKKESTEERKARLLPTRVEKLTVETVLQCAGYDDARELLIADYELVDEYTTIYAEVIGGRVEDIWTLNSASDDEHYRNKNYYPIIRIGHDFSITTPCQECETYGEDDDGKPTQDCTQCEVYQNCQAWDDEVEQITKRVEECLSEMREDSRDYYVVMPDKPYSAEWHYGWEPGMFDVHDNEADAEADLERLVESLRETQYDPSDPEVDQETIEEDVRAKFSVSVVNREGELK